MNSSSSRPVSRTPSPPSPGENADILIVTTPGGGRFACFRRPEHMAYGEVQPESLLEAQEQYDTYFLDSETWAEAKG